MRHPPTDAPPRALLGLGLLVLLAGPAVSSAGCQSDEAGAEAVQSGDSQAVSVPGDREKGAENADEPSAEPSPVETMTVGALEFRETFEVPGTTEAARQVRVAAEAPGRILQAPFEEGDDLRPGALLIRVEADVDNARIDRLEHQLETARRELKRTRELSEDGLATSQQLDQAESQVRDLELRLKEAKIGLSNVATRSPIAGRVTRKFVEVGEFASPGAPIAELVDPSRLKLTAAVPESRIQSLEAGQGVEVRFPALDTARTATISTLPVGVSPRTRTYPIEIELDAEEGVTEKDGQEDEQENEQDDDQKPDEQKDAEPRIRPGMRANMTFTRKVWQNALVVPRTAVLQGYDAQEVAVIPADGSSEKGSAGDGRPRAELRTVELGPGAGNRVVVTEGLKPGDRVVVRGHRSLTDGRPVEIVESYESLDAALQ